MREPDAGEVWILEDVVVLALGTSVRTGDDIPNVGPRRSACCLLLSDSPRLPTIYQEDGIVDRWSTLWFQDGTTRRIL